MRRFGRSEAGGAEEGRLHARPRTPGEPGAPGLHRLPSAGERDPLLYAPESYRPERPAPLAVMLHGAGGNAQHGLSLVQKLADAAGVILLSPASRRQTWDVILGSYGPDVELIDRALALTFERYAVDPEHVAVGGFSDGASYALSLGIANGDLFRSVIAFSPGFMAPAAQVGEPRIFISHGTMDHVLPIDRCSRKLVPRLEQAGYEVLYREFIGLHQVPGHIAREALEWFLPDETRKAA